MELIFSVGSGALLHLFFLFEIHSLLFFFFVCFLTCCIHICMYIYCNVSIHRTEIYVSLLDTYTALYQKKKKNDSNNNNNKEKKKEGTSSSLTKELTTGKESERWIQEKKHNKTEEKT